MTTNPSPPYRTAWPRMSSIAESIREAFAVRYASGKEFEIANLTQGRTGIKTRDAPGEFRLELYPNGVITTEPVGGGSQKLVWVDYGWLVAVSWVAPKGKEKIDRGQLGYSEIAFKFWDVVDDVVVWLAGGNNLRRANGTLVVDQIHNVNVDSDLTSAMQSVIGDKNGLARGDISAGVSFMTRLQRQPMDLEAYELPTLDVIPDGYENTLSRIVIRDGQKVIETIEETG